tara:strand:- start:1993 stop:2136 length:144 start_codon:yes stop_codon:yes gene_type:complete
MKAYPKKVTAKSPRGSKSKGKSKTKMGDLSAPLFTSKKKEDTSYPKK